MYNDHDQQQRLRSLQAVDEMIHEPVTMIEATAELENTYIFFTTDNGYHISQHRMNPGKNCGYNTDSNVPFFVRGPGIEEGGIVDTVAGHIDVAATLLQLAGVEKQLNGEFLRAIYGLRSDENAEAGEKTGLYFNNSYKTVRLFGEGFSMYYSVWCVEEKELYDLQADPLQPSTSSHPLLLLHQPLHSSCF
ncbi:N-acetylglucosamine-6-sulfatase [Ilyonectria destructans]|nr:N-acetylglucosamine-6-sulfatase [Ilyonectria destructans]